MKHVFTKCSVFFAIFSFVAILFTNELHATTCASATVINPASIPISGQSLVCGATNDLTYSGAAGSIKVAPCSGTSSYGGGLEALYVFTPTVTQTYTISISGQTWTSIMVTLGCPTTAGSTCVAAAASSASSKSVNAALTAGQTYYIWFDTWPTPNSPCPGTFSIVPLYVPCSNITNISACAVTASTTWVAGSNSTYNPPATTCGFSTPGQERIYSFTPTITGIHQINITAITGGYYDFFLKAASGGCNGTGWTCLGDRNATGTFGTLNLTAGTQYYIMLDPEQTTAGSISFEILCPALCGNITLGTPTPITANSGTLNWTAGLPTPADYQIEYGEALYSFTGTPQITTTSGATSFNLTGLTGNTYYQYRIRSVCPGPQYGNWSSTGVFVTTMTNDDCAGAIALSSCTGSPKTKSGTTTGSTVDAIYSNCGAGGSGTTERGVWYTYAGDDNAVTMTTCDPSGIGFDSRITVYSGSCGALTCVTSNDDMTPACATGSFRSLVNFNAFAGTTYYIFVHGFQSGAGLSAQGDFILNYSCSALCLPIPPNETCGTATSYTLSTSYTPTTASNNCANADFVTNPTCFSAFATLPDLWYQFTTPPAITTAKIRIDLNGSATGMGYALFSGTCGTLTQIACNSGVTSGTTYDLTGLTGSTTYRIAILGPNGSRGSFDFGLWYESCPAPTALGASGITFNSANLNWTSNAPSSFFDIYYGVSPLAVPNGATTPTVNDYNGGAGGSITYPLGGLNNTTTYQYYVREDCGAGDVSSWSGPFTFSTLAVPPANDDCSGAIALTPCAAPVQAIGLSGATESLPAPGACGGNANDDVWYSFVANSTTMYITVQCFGGYDAVVEGRIGPGCNGTYLGCIDNTLDDEFEDVVLTGATIGQTYYIRVYDWYSATLPPAAGFNIAVAPAGCWQGWNSTAWNDGGNWSNAVVPALCADNVTIPGGLTNYPVVNIVSATAGSVDIQSGASLTINTGNTLNVCGDFINYGTPNIGDGTLNFTSTANQGHIGNTVANFVSVNKTAGVVDIQDGAIDVNTAVQLQSGTLSTLLGGSLRLLSNAPNHAAIIDNFSPTFSGNITGPITAQRYISGAGNVQHQMGLPVAANLGQIGAGIDNGYVIPQPTCDETQSATNSPYGNVFRWDESNPTTCILQGWNVMNSGTANESGRGYSTYQTGGNVIEVTGAPNLAGSYAKTGLGNSNYNLPTLQSSGSYTFNSGWHLLANPYPSGYTYTAQAGFGAVGSVYVPSGPFSGTYQPLNNGDQLAPFQGFMVFKTPGAPATYTHSGTNRVASGSQQFYQNSAAESLEIEVSGNSYRDKTQLRLDDAASNQYDAEYDLRKQRSNLGQPSIFTGHHSEPYRINVQPHTGNVPMGLIPGATGTFTVEVNGIQSFDPTSYIYLEDKVTGVWQNLRTNNSYTFSMNQTESVDRFVLHFTPKAEIATANATCTENGQLTITQPGQAQWIYTATNNTGVQVGSGMLNESNPINLSVPQGIYTITLTDANGYTVTKAVQVNGAQTTSAMFNSSKPVAEVEESISFTTTVASNAATLNWNMGDGTIHSGQATTINHQYSAEGVYTVTLNATSADGCSDVQTKTVTVTAKTTTGIGNIGKGASIRMYPNPNSGNILQVELNNIETATLRITNAIGEVVYTSSISKGQNTVQIGELSAGVYMAEVSNSKLRLTERLVVVK